MKKRLLSVLLTLSMVLTLLPGTAFAAGNGETVNRIRLMDKSAWETATIARAGYDTDDVSWATVTSIRFLTEEGSYTNSGVAAEYDCYSSEGYLADAPGQKILPSEIDRVVVTLNYAHTGWNVGKIEYGVRAVFHREDFDIAYTEGDLGVRKYAELTLKDDAASVGECAVTFMYKPIGATSWSIYDILYVDKGASLGDNMPANPATGTQHFVGWNTSEDGTGDYFGADTEVNGNITVYGIKVTAGGATAYHVMNGSENWLKQEVLDQTKNSDSYTIDKVNICTIQVNGKDESTNPNYRRNGWREYNGIAQNHWYIYNIDLYSTLPIDWNRDVPVEDILSITLTGTIGETLFEVTIPRSELAFKTVSGAGVDVIVEIWLAKALEDGTTTYPVIGTIDNGGTVENGNQNVEEGGSSQAMVFKPAEGYEITGVTVNGSPDSEFQVDNDGSYTYPAQESVTQGITVVVTTTAKKPSYEEYDILVSFCRPDNQNSIIVQNTVASGESATPPTKDGDKTITGWKLDSEDGSLYSGMYDYDALATLVTEKGSWDDTDKKGYLTFYATYAADLYPVYVNVYRNGDTSKPAVSEKLDDYPKGTSFEDILQENGYLTSLDGLYTGGSAGYEWNGVWSHEISNWPAPIGEGTVNGWTNLSTMVYDLEKVVVYGVFDGVKENAQVVWEGTAKFGNNLLDYLNEQKDSMNLAREGYDLDPTWYNWDWYGHKIGADATVNGWTNVYVAYTTQIPNEPTYDDLKDLGFKILVTDKNSPIPHGNLTYGLLENTYTLSQESATSYRIILNVADYAAQYDVDKKMPEGTHVSTTTQGKADFDITWEAGKWTCDDLTETIGVKCTAPNAPTAEELSDLIKITVKDFADGNVPEGAVDHGNQIFAPAEGTYTVGVITPDQDAKTYTATLTLTDGAAYAALLDERLELAVDTHTLTTTVSKLHPITLTFDPATGTWTANRDGWSLGVKCEPEEDVYIIHVKFVDPEGNLLGGGDVISAIPDQELEIADPTAPEGMTFVGWKALTGLETQYNGEFTFTALSELVNGNWTEDNESWLTFEAIFTEKTPEYRVIHVSFVDSDETTSLGGGDVISTYPDQELIAPDPAYFTPKDMTFVGWKDRKSVV